jgi:hypothetical protein
VQAAKLSERCTANNNRKVEYLENVARYQASKNQGVEDLKKKIPVDLLADI